MVSLARKVISVYSIIILTAIFIISLIWLFGLPGIYVGQLKKSQQESIENAYNTLSIRMARVNEIIRATESGIEIATASYVSIQPEQIQLLLQNYPVIDEIHIFYPDMTLHSVYGNEIDSLKSQTETGDSYLSNLKKLDEKRYLTFKKDEFKLVIKNTNESFNEFITFVILDLEQLLIDIETEITESQYKKTEIVTFPDNTFLISNNELTPLIDKEKANYIVTTQTFGSEGNNVINTPNNMLLHVYRFLPLSLGDGISFGILIDFRDIKRILLSKLIDFIALLIALFIVTILVVLLATRVISHPINDLIEQLKSFSDNRSIGRLRKNKITELNFLNRTILELEKTIFENETNLNSIVSQKTQLLEKSITELEEANQKQYIAKVKQTILYKIYEIGYGHDRIENKLNKILNVICVDFFGIQEKGAIFLLKENQLKMVAHKNLEPLVEKNCATVPLGFCFCGKAVLEDSFSKMAHIDDNHDYVSEDMEEHGHYGIPIVYGNQKLGLILFYTDPEIKLNNDISNFFSGIGESIGDLIHSTEIEQERAILVASLKNTAALVAISGQNYEITWANPPFYEFLALKNNVNANLLDYLGRDFKENNEKSINDSIKQSGHWKSELPISFGSKNTRYVETIVSEMKQRKTDERKIIWNMIDVTEHKLEQQRLNEMDSKLTVAQKMESIGLLAGGIAHDFNNILGAIVGYNDLLMLENRNLNGKQIHFLKQSQEAADRAKNLVQQLLTFSRKNNSDDSELLEIPPIVGEVVKLLGSTINKEIKIKYRNQLVNSCLIQANDIGIHQVLMNLGINARDAISGKGIIQIVTKQECVAEKLCSSCNNKFDGNFVVISVNDSGEGFDLNNLSNVFTPFYTTKREGQGSGMGLSVVHSIVHRHHGHIEISNNHIGACVNIFLPIDIPRKPLTNKDKIINDKNSVNSSKPLKKNLSFLIVDDEQSIGEVLTQMLRSKGYLVRYMSSSANAIKFIKTQGNTIDILITDYSMPNYTGDEVIKALKDQENKKQYIVMCSGYSSKINEANSKHFGVDHFMRKPVSIKDIDNMLDKYQTQCDVGDDT